LLGAALAACGERHDRPAEVARLAALAIDPGGITVSGVSSGGYFAHQFHVAHSALITGAAIIAGGPYHCAGDGYPRNALRALETCMNLPDLIPFAGPPAAGETVAAAARAAAAGAIDPLAGLRGDRVFVFSGASDTLVPRPLVDAVAAFYAPYTGADAIAAVTDVPAAHAMITADFGERCDAFGPPFVNDCDYDLAGALLAHLHGPLSPKVAADGALVAFDQSEFVAPGSRHGLAPTGYVYVPRACAAGTAASHRCRLHVALHGCLQSARDVGDAFYRHAGYNGWAEANAIVVLYPQAAAVTTRLGPIPLPWPNPAGCWDWWGFTGPDYAARSGIQVAAIAAMIARLAGR
jgi:poly(3-hydroxybutyrate) depolymerase